MADATEKTIAAQKDTLVHILSLLRDARTLMPRDTLAVPDAEDCLGPYEDDLRSVINRVEAAVGEINLALGLVEEAL